jgi:hypothetical protein
MARALILTINSRDSRPPEVAACCDNVGCRLPAIPAVLIVWKQLVTIEPVAWAGRRDRSTSDPRPPRIVAIIVVRQRWPRSRNGFVFWGEQLSWRPCEVTRRFCPDGVRRGRKDATGPTDAANFDSCGGDSRPLPIVAAPIILIPPCRRPRASNHSRPLHSMLTVRRSNHPDCSFNYEFAARS